MSEWRDLERQRVAAAEAAGQPIRTVWWTCQHFKTTMLDSNKSHAYVPHTLNDTQRQWGKKSIYRKQVKQSD